MPEEEPFAPGGPRTRCDMKKSGEAGGEDGKAPESAKNESRRRTAGAVEFSGPRGPTRGWSAADRSAPAGPRNPSGGGRGGPTRRVVHAVHGRVGIRRVVSSSGTTVGLSGVGLAGNALALYTGREGSLPPGAASFDRRPGLLGAGAPLLRECWAQSNCWTHRPRGISCPSSLKL